MNVSSPEPLLFSSDQHADNVRSMVEKIVPATQLEGIDINRLVLFACKGCTHTQFYSQLDFLLKDNLEKKNILLQFRQTQLELQKIDEHERNMNSNADHGLLIERITNQHGILCKFNFMCCDPCAARAAQHETEASDGVFRGYVYFTARDTCIALRDADSTKHGVLSIWIGFSSMSAANIVHDALSDAGIHVLWNKHIQHKMRASVPRERFHGAARCRCVLAPACSCCQGSGVMHF